MDNRLLAEDDNKKVITAKIHLKRLLLTRRIAGNLRMKRIIFYLLFSFSLPLLGWQSDDKEDRILWSAERKLTWEDFKGRAPDLHNPSKALTSSSIETKSEFLKDEIEFTISAYFYKSKSWVEADSKSDKLLKH